MDKYIKEKDVFVKFAAFFTPADIIRARILLAQIPAADVRENVRGANIAKDFDCVDQFVCSKCGIELIDWVRVERDEDDGEETYHEYRFNYCPNCGAELRGENNG